MLRRERSRVITRHRGVTRPPTAQITEDSQGQLCPQRKGLEKHCVLSLQSKNGQARVQAMASQSEVARVTKFRSRKKF